MIDYKTTNVSFLAVHEKLKGLGILDNNFMLKLDDTDLQGIDVYALNDHSRICHDWRAKVIAECKTNIWYYLREVLRIPHQGEESTAFQLERASCATIWCFSKGINLALSVPRQIGSWMTMDAILSWVYLTVPESVIGKITNDCDDDHLRRIQSLAKRLPEWLTFPVERDMRSPINSRYHHGEYSSIEDPKSPTTKMVPFISDVLYMEDMHYAPNFKNAVALAYETYRHKMLMMTIRPGQEKYPQADEIYAFLHHLIPFTERFYDFTDTIRASILGHMHPYLSTTQALADVKPMVHIQFSHLELGKDMAWIETATAKGQLTADQVRTYYYNVK